MPPAVTRNRKRRADLDSHDLCMPSTAEASRRVERSTACRPIGAVPNISPAAKNHFGATRSWRDRCSVTIACSRSSTSIAPSTGSAAPRSSPTRGESTPRGSSPRSSSPSIASASDVPSPSRSDAPRASAIASPAPHCGVVRDAHPAARTVFVPCAPLPRATNGARGRTRRVEWAPHVDLHHAVASQ